MGFGMSDFFSASPPYLLSLAAAFCFCLAMYFFIRENLKIAATLSALFFLCVVLAYLPQTESIQAFSVDVKLRKSLDRADEIIAQIKELSKANAKMSYMTLAWGNRFDGPKATEKRAIVADIDKQLIDSKVSQDERRDLSSTFVRLIGLDLYYVYKQVMDRLIQAKTNRLQPKPINPTGDNREWMAYQTNLGAWNSEANQPFTLESFDLQERLKVATPKTILSDQELAQAKIFSDQIMTMYSACKAAGNYTKETAEFMDLSRELKGINDKTREVFGYTFE
jgi:hypothetical protein